MVTFVRWITKQEKGGIYQPGDPFSKMGYPMLEVLRFTYPGSEIQTSGILDSYPGYPLEMLHMNLMVYTVTELAQRLSGGAGPVGMEYVCLQH